MKVFSVTIILFTLFVPAKFVNAEPNLCDFSAITAKEREAVGVLQAMYHLQENIKIKGEQLDKLNTQKNLSYNPYNADGVNEYNNLADKFNNIVKQKNNLNNQYNQLKDIFNAKINKIYPSTNIVFVNCLNREIFSIETKTNGLNIDSLNTNTETLKNDTNTLRKETEAIKSNIGNLIEETEAREVYTENFKRNRNNLENSTINLESKAENLIENTESSKNNVGEFRLNIENLEDYKDYQIFDQLNKNY